MEEGYWSHTLTPPLQTQHGSVPAIKRSRTDTDFYGPGSFYGQENHHFLPQGHDLTDYRAARDTKSVEASYDQYLQNVMAGASAGATHFSGNVSGRDVRVGFTNLSGEMRNNVQYRDFPAIEGPETRATGGRDVDGRHRRSDSPLCMDPMVSPGHQVRQKPLPPDASNIVYVEGLPRDCTQREVAHIFRPFLGYKETRLVKKEPRYRSGEPILLCFVDFANAASAATAIAALQGYKMDTDDPKSVELHLQFARQPPSRSGHGSRGRR